jgi:hypothetical protein
MFNHKNFVHLLSLILIAVILGAGLSLTTFNVQAESQAASYPADVKYSTTTPIPEASSYKNSAVFTFKDIGQMEDMVLHYPDARTIHVDFPDNWSISSDSSYLNIHYDYDSANLSADQAVSGGKTAAANAPLIEVRINDYYAGSFQPIIGANHNARIALPLQSVAATAYTSNPSKELGVTFKFSSSDRAYCNYDGLLTILNDSNFEINFVPIPPNRYLWAFPDSIVEGSFLTEALVFVLPDQYNDNDFNAAVKMAAVIGSAGMTNIQYKVLSASQITQSNLSGSNVIVIGTPSENALVNQLYRLGIMPSTLSSKGVIWKDNAPLADKDGIAQLVPSTANKLFSMLVITANTREGINSVIDGLLNDANIIRKADITYRPNGQPKLIYAPAQEYNSNIVAFHPRSPQPVKQQTENKEYTVTFSQQFFRTQLIQDVISGQYSLQFFVPREWDIQGGAKIILNYSYSAKNISKDAYFSVNLNGIPMGNYSLDNKNVGTSAKLEVALDPKDFLPGTVNIITFTVSSKSNPFCENGVVAIAGDANSPWMIIRDDSKLVLPFLLSTDESTIISNPFFYLANEANLLMVLPQKNENADLENILTIAARLGNAVKSITPLNIKITSAADIDLEAYKGFNLLVYGQPSQNAFLAKYNDKLPQPFMDNQKLLKPSSSALDFHFPQDSDIGLIEMISMDVSPARGMTVITGTSAQGIKYVIDNTKYFPGYDGGNLFYVVNNNKVFKSQVNVNIVEVKPTEEPTAVQGEIVLEPTATTAKRATLQLTSIPVNSRDLANSSANLFYWILGGAVFVFIFQFIIRLILKKR